MGSKDLDNIKKTVNRYLERGRLHDALALLSDKTEGAMFFELGDKVKKLRQTYGLMLRYLTEGANDPERDRMLRNIIAEAYGVLDEYIIRQDEKDVSTLYFDSRRVGLRMYGPERLRFAIRDWQEAQRKARSLSTLFNDALNNDNEAFKAAEKTEKELFTAIWNSYPLTKSDAALLVDIIGNKETSVVTAVRLTGALFLAAMEFADTEVINALADVYAATGDEDDDSSRAISALALVAIILILFKYRNRTLPTALVSRLEALSMMRFWRSDLKTAFMELVRTHDTERVNKKMYDEIIPDMMSMRPNVGKKLEDLTTLDFDSLRDNPEWEEMLRNSGLEEKLKELNDLQMEGSDLYMGSFSYLKNFPFFSELINWFTPFNADAYPVKESLNNDPRLVELYELASDLPYMCDNDKFSIFYSISMVGNKRDSVLNAMVNQREQLKEMRSMAEGITRKDKRKNDITNVVRNLYRFFKLFRRKGEFHNSFNGEINLLDVPLLRSQLEDVELLQLIGEFYFSHSYYKESLTVFNKLDEMGEFDATLYQKMGYAYQQTGDTDNAIRFYEQADLLDNQSRWLRLRLATVYRQTGRIHDAVDILASLSEARPDDAEVALQLGYTYTLAENYREALKHLYRAEFDSPENTRILRPIAWSLFMVHEFEKAMQYYSKIISIEPQADDYLNMGHLSLARRNYKEAINYYKLFLNSKDNNIETLFKAFHDDKAHLIHGGVDNKEISLIADAILYDIDGFVKH